MPLNKCDILVKLCETLDYLVLLLAVNIKRLKALLDRYL